MHVILLIILDFEEAHCQTGQSDRFVPSVFQSFVMLILHPDVPL